MKKLLIAVLFFGAVPVFARAYTDEDGRAWADKCAPIKEQIWRTASPDSLRKEAKDMRKRSRKALERAQIYQRRLAAEENKIKRKHLAANVKGAFKNIRYFEGKAQILEAKAEKAATKRATLEKEVESCCASSDGEY